MTLRPLALLLLTTLLPLPAFAQKGGVIVASRNPNKITRTAADFFVGSYQGPTANVVITGMASSATVGINDKGNRFGGVGYALDGLFASSTGLSRVAGVTVYRLDPGGKLAGTGVFTPDGRNVGNLSENLAGPKSLVGTYVITSSADIYGRSYGGTCTISRMARDAYRLHWKVDTGEYYGVGLMLNGKLWTAWSTNNDAYLTIFNRESTRNYYTLHRLTLFNTGAPATELPPVSKVAN